MRDLIAQLTAIAGSAHVLTDPEVVAGYATDWTRRYRGIASCVVRPGSAVQVADVIRACAALEVPVVPQGGNTGLVGGSVPPPRPPEPTGHRSAAPRSRGSAPVILSLARLDHLGPVDVTAGQVTAGTGVTIARLSAHAEQAGLRYGVDLASRDSATVGGTIATNAGGIRTIRYGPTRSQVAGVTAVLADGTVISAMSGLTAGSAGYDLAHLLTGSEGTLGVITQARLVLRPAEPAAAVLLAGVAGIAEAAALYAGLRAEVPGLSAAEYLDEAGLDLVLAVTGLPAPLRPGSPGYLLAEIAGTPGWGRAVPDPRRLASAGLPANAVLAQDRRDQAGLWAYRERLTESIAAVGIPHKIDVAVPAAKLASFRSELDEVVVAAAGPARPAGGGRAPGVPAPADHLVPHGDFAPHGEAPHGEVAPHGDFAPYGRPRVIVFGHIGVGNLHVNVLGPDPDDTAVDAAVARLAAACGGSVAAEHGVGRAKTGWLGWSVSAAEIAAMRAIKSALDPAGLLNPGVLLPSDSG